MFSAIKYITPTDKHKLPSRLSVIVSACVCIVRPQQPFGGQPKQRDCVIVSGPAEKQKNIYCQVWFGKHSSEKQENEKNNEGGVLLLASLYRGHRQKTV